jgi:hypothetical protein
MRVVEDVPKPIYGLPISPRLIGNHLLDRSQRKRENCVAALPRLVLGREELRVRLPYDLLGPVAFESRRARVPTRDASNLWPPACKGPNRKRDDRTNDFDEVLGIGCVTLRRPPIMPTALADALASKAINVSSIAA